jgi:hypothetical protein
MRQTFREWYPPTTDELKLLWANGIVILDSSVLLGLYQYPPVALEEFFGVLDGVSGRLWLPHQVGLEYHRNREGRIPQQRLVLDRLIGEVESLGSNLDNLALPEFHPTLDIEELESRRLAVKTALDELADQIRSARAEIPELSPAEVLTSDPVFERISDLFDGKVGPPLPSEELEALKSEGAKRYEAEIPPGFKDRDKDEDHRYNDLIIWKQILTTGKRETDSDARRPAIFVTNDRKEDWWRRRQSVILGPRTELIREYMDTVGQDFYMYLPGTFLEAAREHLMLDVSTETIDEVRRVSSTSRVAGLLRSQRMVLPHVAVRIDALGRIYEAIHSGEVSVVGDLNSAIEGIGGDFSSGYVATPLFFSLISEAYGPIRVELDPSRRLRERAVREVRERESKAAFVDHAHSAWLAQALYRVRLEGLSDEELLVGFFGDDYPREAIVLLRRAQEFLEAELASRGET